MVVQVDGTLRPVDGEIYRPRRVRRIPNDIEIWRRLYYRGKSTKWNATFRQIEATFARENNWNWPSHDMPLMPKEPGDWYRKVASVDRSDLL